MRYRISCDHQHVEDFDDLAAAKVAARSLSEKRSGLEVEVQSHEPDPDPEPDPEPDPDRADTFWCRTVTRYLDGAFLPPPPITEASGWLRYAPRWEE